MSQHSESKAERSINLPSGISADSALIIRLIVAVVVFAVSLIVNMSTVLCLLLRFVAVAAAGYDIVFRVLDDFDKKDYFSESMLILFVTVISFAIGYSGEGTALVILYRLCKLAVEYVAKRSVGSAEELMQYQEENVTEKIKSIISDDASVHMDFEDTIASSSGLILKGVIILAVLYAIFLPIITNYSFSVSIHRALMMLVVATPASLVAAVPITAKTGLCYAAGQGIIFKNAHIVEKTAAVETAVFDKTGIFTEGAPRLLSAQSDVLPASTFMTFAAHSVYYSEQPFAKAISANFSSEYKLEVISNFNEIDGSGVELDIGGSHVILAKQDVFAERGISIPVGDEDLGQTYFMCVGDRYVGKLELSNDFNEDSSDLSNGMRDAGISKCVLLTEDGKNESEDAATELDFDAFYSQCNPSKKRDIIADVSARSEAPIMYVYASGIEAHSDAYVDIRIARKGKYADALVLPQFLAQLPMSVKISRRVMEIVSENAIFAFAIKALVIFLAFNGFCTLWFALFIDYAAAIATMLNSIRITNDSLLNRFKK